jgi:trimeric autotransporter adhesin
VTAAEGRLTAAISALTTAARAAASSASSGKGTGTGTGGTGTSGSAAGTGQGQQSGSSQSANTQSGSSQSGSSQTGNQQTGNQQGASQQAGRGSGTAGPASAEQLAADHAQIDAANANLELARRNLTAAVLTSPITGTVAAVTMVPGQAASATSSITVIGSGQEQVSTTVSLADLELVKVGDPATVTVDGVATPLPGRVSAIGLLNTTTGSTTSYPVTVLLAPTTARLFDGSGASVSIQVAKVTGVLTVPSSAVHTVGRLSTVTRVEGGRASSVRVTVGAVGSDRTEIRSGLSAGDQVVLATLGTALPSSDSTTNRRLTGGFTGSGATFGGAGTGRPGG